MASSSSSARTSPRIGGIGSIGAGANSISEDSAAESGEKSGLWKSCAKKPDQLGRPSTSEGMPSATAAAMAAAPPRKRIGPGAALNILRRKGDRHLYNFFHRNTHSSSSSHSQKSGENASPKSFKTDLKEDVEEPVIVGKNFSSPTFATQQESNEFGIELMARNEEQRVNRLNQQSADMITTKPSTAAAAPGGGKTAHSNSTSSSVTLTDESADVFVTSPPMAVPKRSMQTGGIGRGVYRRETGSDVSVYHYHIPGGGESSAADKTSATDACATPTLVHRPMTISSSISAGLSGSGGSGGVSSHVPHFLVAAHGLGGGHPGSGRRESFLYRGIDEREPFYNMAPLLSTFRPISRASSVASSDPLHGDDLIVTPFAQLLASLRNVRGNLAAIANLPSTSAASGGGASAATRRNAVGSPLWSSGSAGAGCSSSMPALPEPVQQCALETLDELDWCLDQLEAIQTHRSVTEMASSKFRKLLNKELSQFAESSKSGTQISKFLINTYMEDRNEDDEGRNPIGSIKSGESGQLSRLQQKRHSHFPGSAAECAPSTSIAAAAAHSSLFNKAKTAAMSKISGVRRLRTGLLYMSGVEPPEYGVHCQKEIRLYMQALDNWGPDIFRVHELSKQHSLTAITYTLLKERKLLEQFDVPADVLVTYLLHLEHHYRPNPYHNQIHAADVAQSIHVLISSPALDGVFSELEVLAAIIAAAIHDVDHPGYTNQYLINTNSELAIMYNDESVLEQHHLAVAFKLLQDPHCDFLVGLSKKQRQLFRKIAIEMILATDMSKHMTLLADLKTMVEAKKVSNSSVITLDKYNDRIQVLQSMIHLADLSNPTKPIELYRKWNERILEEYWRQGDKEKEQNLEVSPMCDRGNVTIEKSQVGFIDYIVHPLFETWAELVYPDAQTILDQLEDNRQWYLARIDPEDRPPELNVMESLASSVLSSAVMSRKRFVGDASSSTLGVPPTAGELDESASPGDDIAGGSIGTGAGGQDCTTESTIAAVAAALVAVPSAQRSEN